MKSIDVKSLIIGALLTSTIFLGVAAAPSGTGTAKDASVWDDKQEWEIKRTQQDQSIGWEPFGCDKNYVFYRRRTK